MILKVCVINNKEKMLTTNQLTYHTKHLYLISILTFKTFLLIFKIIKKIIFIKKISLIKKIHKIITINIIHLMLIKITRNKSNIIKRKSMNLLKIMVYSTFMKTTHYFTKK